MEKGRMSMRQTGKRTANYLISVRPGEHTYRLANARLAWLGQGPHPSHSRRRGIVGETNRAKPLTKIVGRSGPQGGR